MTISDFDGAQFWPAVKAFVIASGVEPISLGEPEDEIWRKIFAAMELSGTPLSLGMTPGELMRQTYATVTGGGAPPGFDFLRDVDGTILYDIDNQPLWGLK